MISKTPYLFNYQFLKAFHIFGKIISYSSVKKTIWDKQSYAILVRFNNTYEASVAVFFLNGLELFNATVSAKILKKKNLQPVPEPKKIMNPKYPFIKLKKNPKNSSSMLNHLRTFGSCSIETHINSSSEASYSFDLIHFYDLKMINYCYQSIDGEFFFSKKINAYCEKKNIHSNFENRRGIFKNERLVEYNLKKSKKSWLEFFFSFFKLPNQPELKKKAMVEMFEVLVDYVVFENENKLLKHTDLCIFSLIKVTFNSIFQNGFFFTEWNGIKFNKKIQGKNPKFFN